MPYQVKEHHWTLWKQNISRLGELQGWISRQGQERNDFYVVLEQFVNTTDEEIRRMQPEASPREVAWGVRNLYEVRILCHYAFRSKDNLKRFIKDYFIDGEEVVERLLKFAVIYEPHFPGIQGDALNNKDLLTGAKEYRQKQIPGKDSPLSVKAVAREVGMLEEYDDVHKITSKLVHATSFSILRDAGYIKQLLLPTGLYVANTFIQELAVFATEYGYTIPGESSPLMSRP